MNCRVDIGEAGVVPLEYEWDLKGRDKVEEVRLDETKELSLLGR